MNQISMPAARKLKAVVEAKRRARPSRTAFKLLPKVSRLLDWMLNTTDLSVNALFRTQLDESADAGSPSSRDTAIVFTRMALGLSLDKEERLQVEQFITEAEAAPRDPSRLDEHRLMFLLPASGGPGLSKVTTLMSAQAKRRSVALDADLILQVENLAKEWGLSRDVCINLLLATWAYNWQSELKEDIDFQPKAEACIEAANGMIQEPNWTELRKQFTIYDSGFWRHLERTWGSATEYFYQTALEYLPSVPGVQQKKQYLKEYEAIVGARG